MTRHEQLKDKYKLWVEFLKESESYKYYCENEADPDELENWSIRRIYLSGWNQLKNDSTLKHKFQHKFFGIYLIFRDVYSPEYDFEKWWNDIMLKLIKLFEKEPYVLLKMDRALKWYAEELTRQLDEIFEAVFEGFAQNEVLNKDYVMELCKIALEQALKKYFEERKGLLSLLVYTDYPKQELIERFTKIVVEHKRSYKITEDVEKEFMNNLLPTPINKRLKSELEKYLKVYRLWKKKIKWINIVKQVPQVKKESEYIGPNLRGSREIVDINVLRVFQLYNEKAKRIIKNVENGYFPGNY